LREFLRFHENLYISARKRLKETQARWRGFRN
jgi:hypothetical protein